MIGGMRNIRENLMLTQTDREVIKEVFKAFEIVPPPKETYIVIARSQGRSNFMRRLMWQLRELRLSGNNASNV